MKIVAFADNHGNLLNNIPNGDVLCISGDICPLSNHDVVYQKNWIEEIFLQWCEDLLKNKVFKDIIFIAGNHDWRFEELFEIGEEDTFRNTLPKGVHYLRDNSVTIGGVKFYGTPWQPVFGAWAFNKYEGELDKIFEKIPENTDVLLSHGPPIGYNDKVEGRSEHLGSKALMKHVRRVKPHWVFVGHIHTGSHVPATFMRTSIVNVSLSDERYKIVYPPYICNC